MKKKTNDTPYLNLIEKLQQDQFSLEDLSLYESSNLSGIPFSHQLIFDQNYEIFKIFVSKKLDNSQKDFHGNSILHIISQYPLPDLLKLVIDSNRLNLTNDYGHTPLHIASKLNNIVQIKILLEAGANPNLTCDWTIASVTYKTVSPFLLSIIYGNIETFNLFINSSKIIYDSSIPSIGNLLHISIQFQQFSILNLLLQNQSIIPYLSKTNSFDLTPIDFAKSLNFNDAISIINGVSGSNIKLKNDINSKFQVENLIFQGGGAKGVAYLGALKYLNENNLFVNVKRTAGTSAGAITSALLSVGYSYEELSQIILNLNLMELLDIELGIPNYFTKFVNIFKDMFSSLKNPIDSIINFIKNKWNSVLGDNKSGPGLFSGEKFRIWFEDLIEKKTKKKFLTFGELRELIASNSKYYHLHVFSTNIAKDQIEITHFSSEDTQWDDVIISDAVRSSMSLPGVFIPHIIHIKDQIGNRNPKKSLGQFVDGGLFYNYPIEVFDKIKYSSNNTNSLSNPNSFYLNQFSLGFSLYSPDLKPPKMKNVTGTIDLISTICGFFYNSEIVYHDRLYENQFRTIRISNCNISTYKFNLKNEEKDQLILSGYNSVKLFFEFSKNKNNSSKSRFDDNFGLSLIGKRIGSLDQSFIPRHSLTTEIENTYERAKPLRLILEGASGNGKSQIASRFALNHKDDFLRIWTFDCGSEESLYRSYQDFALFLGIFNNKISLKDLIIKVHESIQNTPCLFLYDNSLIPMDFLLLNQNISIIITSSDVSKLTLKGFSIIKIERLNLSEANDFIIQVLGKENKELLDYYHKNPSMTSIKLSSTLTYLKGNINSSIDQIQDSDSGKFIFDFFQNYYPQIFNFLCLLRNFNTSPIPSLLIDSYLYVETIDPNLIPNIKKEFLMNLSSYSIISLDSQFLTFEFSSYYKKLIIKENKCIFKYQEKLIKMLSYCFQTINAHPLKSQMVLLFTPHLSSFISANWTTSDSINKLISTISDSYKSFGQYSDLYILLHSAFKKNPSNLTILLEYMNILQELGMSTDDVDLEIEKNFSLKEIFKDLKRYKLNPHESFIPLSKYLIMFINTFKNKNNIESQIFLEEIFEILSNLFFYISYSFEKKYQFKKSLKIQKYTLDLFCIFNNLSSNTESKTINSIHSQNLNKIGSIYYKLNKYSKSLSYHLNSLKLISQEFIDDLISTYNYIALTYSKLNKFKDSLSFYEKSLSLLKDQNHYEISFEFSTIYNNIGITQHLLKNYKESLNNLFISLKIKKQLFSNGIHPSISTNLLNIGIVYSSLGMIKESIQYNKESLAIGYQCDILQIDSLAEALFNIGEHFHQIGKFEESLIYHKQSLNLREQLEPYGKNILINSSLEKIIEIKKKIHLKLNS